MRNLLIAMMLATLLSCVRRFPVESPVEQNPASIQVLRFTAQPRVIHRGESAVLSWNVRNAASVELEEAFEPSGTVADPFLHLLGRFSSSGTFTVSPKSSATYVLSCGGSDSQALCVSASVSIIVK
ncbi:MAG TPA: hypothetical protein VKT81_24400 [Bryobacteraceae bacterium]|nr:hypothetical protein [Bryobacteraceae bacterium]